MIPCRALHCVIYRVRHHLWRTTDAARLVPCQGRNANLISSIQRSDGVVYAQMSQTTSERTQGHRRIGRTHQGPFGVIIVERQIKQNPLLASLHLSYFLTLAVKVQPFVILGRLKSNHQLVRRHPNIGIECDYRGARSMSLRLTLYSFHPPRYI